MSVSDRENWSSRLGFVLACVGAAIGLGNIWLFPWRLGAYGGAAFLIPYLFFVIALGSTGLMEEFAFGRERKAGSIKAFESVFAERDIDWGAKLGVIPVLGVTGVFVFYSIVVGWILKYFLLALQGKFSTISNLPAYFGSFSGSPETILWHLLAIIITVSILRLGIKRGIERVNKVLMPTLFIILFILLIRSLTLPGSLEGVKFLLIPDWSQLANLETWVMALGQAFFTVSLGGAAMLVYGSYLEDDADIPASAVQTVIFNTCASFLAAFVIIPAVFAFGLDPQAGPPLLFITLPKIFQQMPGGYLFGVLFFLSIIFAAISSAMNLMEVPVEAVMDRFDWTRKKSVLLIGGLTFLIGIPLDLNMSFFGGFADFVTIYLIPIGAVMAAITFFWVYDIKKARKAINRGAKNPVGSWWEPFAKYIFTGIAVVVLVLGIIFGGIG